MKQTSRALQYIADDSGSPMETRLTILLVLPFRLGGYGFPLPEMNKRIDLKAAMTTKTNKQYYKCDLFWKDYDLAAEYDSIRYHSDSRSIASDSIRRGDLLLSGIDVVTVTDKQVNGVEEFDKVARQLASKMDRRIKIRNPQFEARQQELLN